MAVYICRVVLGAHLVVTTQVSDLLDHRNGALLVVNKDPFQGLLNLNHLVVMVSNLHPNYMVVVVTINPSNLPLLNIMLHRHSLHMEDKASNLHPKNTLVSLLSMGVTLNVDQHLVPHNKLRLKATTTNRL
jgi:hypothetical protein